MSRRLSAHHLAVDVVCLLSQRGAVRRHRALYSWTESEGSVHTIAIVPVSGYAEPIVRVAVDHYTDFVDRIHPRGPGLEVSCVRDELPLVAPWAVDVQAAMRSGGREPAAPVRMRHQPPWDREYRWTAAGIQAARQQEPLGRRLGAVS